MKRLPMPGRKGLWLLIAGGALLGFAAALRPLADPDFWWHLQTGAELVRNGGLLAADPFCFTSSASASAQAQMTLNGYWACQLLYWAVHAIAGLPGILALNLVLLLTLYAVLVRLLLVRENPCGIDALLLLLGLAVLLTTYQLERPQTWSFLFALLLVALLDRFRDRRALSGWLFPLMLLWGNWHGGVLVGMGMLGLFAIGAGIQLRHERALLARCLAWAGAGIACGLVNPAAIDTVAVYANVLAGRQAMGAGIIEYASTLATFREGNYWLAGLWVLIALHALGLLLAPRRWLADWLLFVVLALGSWAYTRNAGFFAISLLPQTAHYLRQAKLADRAWVRQAAGAGCILVAALLLLRVYQRQEVAAAGQMAAFFPARLVEFVTQAGIEGRAYNDYDWGGFLIWSLYPQSRMFIDGRNLDTKVYEHWQRIRWATQFDVRGQPEYLTLLDRYGVEYVIQKNISKVGLSEPLMRNLLARDDWFPVYQDDQGYVLVRNLPKYRQVIERNRIDKSLFMNNLLELYRQKIAEKNDARLYLGRGELHLSLNNLAAARSDLQTARQALGDDPYLENLLKKAGW